MQHPDFGEGEPRRRLATIFAADVAGYSRLMAEDEEATLRTLKAHREVIDRLIARHEGRIFSTAGDSVIAEFSSPVEALRCSIAIQDELRARNAALVESRRMHLRVGLNVGDVLADGPHLYGDGVNVAARLESLADPGGICVSGSVFSLVKNKLSFGFEDIGPQRVKNIPEPVPAFKLRADAARARNSMAKSAWWLAAAAAALIAGAALWWSVARYSPAPPPPVATGYAPSRWDIERSRDFVGMRVEGTSRVTGRPFLMRLNPNAKAEVEIELAAGPGQKRHDAGIWWINEKGDFCIQFSFFAGGNLVCRRIALEGFDLVAYTWDKQPDVWAFRK